jgi:hypothetical protein
MVWFYRFKNWCILRKQEIAFGAIIFFVATMSFGLGYLAHREYTTAPIIIEQHIPAGVATSTSAAPR